MYKWVAMINQKIVNQVQVPVQITQEIILKVLKQQLALEDVLLLKEQMPRKVIINKIIALVQLLVKQDVVLALLIADLLLLVIVLAVEDAAMDVRVDVLDAQALVLDVVELALEAAKELVQQLVLNNAQVRVLLDVLAIAIMDAQVKR